MEIEIRAFIDDVGEFKKILKKLGATYEYEAHIIDSWHCDKNGSKFEEVQQDKPGSYGLRIRKQIDKDFSKSELNCKVLKSEGDHNVFYEFESKIHDSEQVGEILKHIGFKVFCTVDKKRTAYKLGKCTVNIEEIKGFRPAVELEIISDEKEEEHKQYLKNLLKDLQIKEENKIEKSITHLYMKDFSFKKN